MAAETDEVQTFSRQRPKWLRVFDKIVLTGILGIDTIPPPPEELAAAAALAEAKAKKAQASEASEVKPGEQKEEKKEEPTKTEEKAEKEAKAEVEADEADASAKSAEALCSKLESSPMALVVFKGEAGRDAALEKCESIVFLGETVKLRPLITEPMGVQWENMGIAKSTRRERLFASIKMIILAGVVWAAIIYLPYAWYASSFSYTNGDKPSTLMNASLAVIVVLGNLLMYTTCAEAAKRIGHMLRDTEEGVYMASG